MSKNKKKSYIETTKVNTDRDGDFDLIETSTYIYNSKGRLVSEEFARQNFDYSSNSYINHYYYEYDKKGNVIKKNSELDHDGDGNIDRRELITQAYDRRGNLSSKATDQDTNGDGIIDDRELVTYQYDRRGDLLKEIRVTGYPDLDLDYQYITDYSYNEDHKLVKAYTLPYNNKGERVDNGFYRNEEYQYDEEGRLLSHIIDDRWTGWDYIESWIYKYDEEGNLSYYYQEYKGSYREIIYTYDIKDNMLTETINYGGYEFITNAYSYDDKGHIDSKVAIAGYLISVSDYEYDRKGDLKEILVSNDYNIDSTIDSQDLYKYFYDKSGTLISEIWNYGNDGVIEHEYTRSLIDPDFQLSESSLLV